MNNLPPIVQQMLANNRMINNPMIQNALQMYQRGDINGINQLAQNLCREKGVDMNEAIRQIKSQFGF